MSSKPWINDTEMAVCDAKMADMGVWLRDAHLLSVCPLRVMNAVMVRDWHIPFSQLHCLHPIPVPCCRQQLLHQTVSNSAMLHPSGYTPAPRRMFSWHMVATVEAPCSDAMHCAYATQTMMQQTCVHHALWSLILSGNSVCSPLASISTHTCGLGVEGLKEHCKPDPV